MQYQLKIGSRDFTVEVGEQNSGRLRVSVNGTPYDVDVQQAAPSHQGPIAEPVRQTATGMVAAPSAAEPVPGAATRQGTIVAPIPGLIIEIKVRLGDKVQAGQSVAVMEAMKMENDLTTHVSGVVEEILVQKGAEVATGDVILRIGVV
jgi:glutaconyl-CoA/methylmalonyl-CoA decarboxylase subunit gamma